MPRHREGLHRPDITEAIDATVDPKGSREDLTDVEWEEAPPPAPLWRSRILIPAVLMIAVVAVVWWTVSWLTTPGISDSETVPASVPLSAGAASAESSVQRGSPTADGSSEQAQSEDEAIVHVAGQVRTPGIVRLPASSRVVDAVQAAGGPTDEARLDLVNLAAPLTDGAQILVPGSDDAATSPPGTVPSGAAAGAGGAGAATVNVNRADATALESLPGIGPALAQRIIDHREQVGPFGSFDDLDAVSGIGPAMLERLDGLVSW